MTAIHFRSIKDTQKKHETGGGRTFRFSLDRAHTMFEVVGSV